MCLPERIDGTRIEALLYKGVWAEAPGAGTFSAGKDKPTEACEDSSTKVYYTLYWTKH